MAHLLITGAAGYIGSTLVEEALKAGHKVTALDRFFFGEDVLGDLAKSRKLKRIKKDIRDAEPEDFAGVDVVIDLAALSNDPAGDLDPDLTESINFRGRSHVALVAKAAGVGRYLMSSSCSVYGYSDEENLTELSPTNPQTVYACSMLKAEQHALKLADGKFIVTPLRLATVFGFSRRMRFDLVVNTMTRNAIETGRIIVTGGGKQWRPLIHVRDVARGFLHTAKLPASVVSGKVFNLGKDNYRINQLAFTVRETLPIQLSIEVMLDTNDHRSYSVSYEKSRKVLGFEPKYDVAHGVNEIYQAFKLGKIDRGSRTVTVGWYKQLLEAERLVDGLRLNGRML